MTVVLVDPRRPSLVPVEAITLLAGDVQYTEEMPVKVPWSLPASRPAYDGEDAPVLLSSDPNHPMVQARIAAGEKVITSPAPRQGEHLLDAVAMMDTLRTSGPWEGEQTHESLRRYLLEETYELFDAIRSGETQELREELGDVLLQVLFHARIAEETPELPFDIDDVADALVRKLGNRVPTVLAGEPISLDDQLAQWEERKAAEKSRGSAMDDVPTAQPALALTQKIFERATAAGVPLDLVPESLVTIGQVLGGDAENALRSEALDFIDTVRKVEQAVAASRRGPDVPEELAAPVGTITDEEWRAHWPTNAVAEELVVEELVVEQPAAEDEDESVEAAPADQTEAVEEPEIVVAEDDSAPTDEDQVPDEEPEPADQDSSVEPQ